MTRLPELLGAATVAEQIAYPLVTGRTRDRLTVTTVGTFFTASLAHAVREAGPCWALRFTAVSAGTGFAAEALGLRTGVPFGRYSYRGSLGPRLAGVPAVIPLAWSMMAYPAQVLAQRGATTRATRVLLAAWALAAWDLFLDPQMVAAGHWDWDAATGRRLLGVPVTNYLGWFATAAVLMSLLEVVAPEPVRHSGRDDRLPLALYLWTFAGSVLANAAFFGRPAVAATGGVGMGLAILPAARRGRRRDARR